MRKTLPKIGQRCSTPTGEGKVISLNILRRQVTLVVEGQRVEVPDRDLGLVVRWDTASKSGEPPPSISRADAIAQGLIEETAEDREAALLADDDPWARETVMEPGPGRGRLPGGGPRKEARPRPATKPEQKPTEQSARAPRSVQGGRTRAPSGDSPSASTPPQGRVFQRSTPPPTPPKPEPGAAEEGETAARAGRRRGRRGRGGRGPLGTQPPAS